MELEFSGQIFVKPQISDFLKFHLVQVELFHEGRQTDRHDKVLVAFSKSANVPKTQITQTS
jgi:hypothetical protein